MKLFRGHPPLDLLADPPKDLRNAPE
jgi:hypothetical protein